MFEENVEKIRRKTVYYSPGEKKKKKIVLAYVRVDNISRSKPEKNSRARCPRII